MDKRHGNIGEFNVHNCVSLFRAGECDIREVKLVATDFFAAKFYIVLYYKNSTHDKSERADQECEVVHDLTFSFSAGSLSAV